MRFKQIALSYCLLLVFVATAQVSQIKGKVTSSTGAPISNCFVFIKNTTYQTNTDSLGYFSLPITKEETLFIQKKGYETAQQKVNNKIEYSNLDIVLKNTQELNLLYEEPQDQYALFLISQMRLQNEQLNTSTTTDYYSKGKLELTSKRESYLGQKRKDLDPSLDLDSISNIIYLSELKSKLTTHNMQGVHENVISVKERGSNKNILFQTGTNSNFNFYNKEVSPQINLLSPLYKNADLYYYYKLEQISSSADGETFYTISFTPKRSREPVCEGTLTISGKNWQLLHINATMLGTNVNLKDVQQLTVNQNFRFDESINRNVKVNQDIKIIGRFLVFDFAGEFKSTYQNQRIIRNNLFSKPSKELISYDHDFDQLTERDYEKNRAIPLSSYEKTFFDLKKPLLSDNTRAILDSVDKRTNNFTLFKLIKGYEYINSYENTHYSYRGLISTFAFNAVQGFNVTTGIDYTKFYNDNQQSKMGLVVNYGTNEDKFRFSGYITHIFNQINYNTLNISGGSSIQQFNQDAPIKTPINSFASAWFGKNYAKFFQKEFIKIDYSQYILQGIKVNVSTEYALRTTLQNHVKSPPFVPTLDFDSNNPLDPNDFTNEPFINNNIFKINLGADIVFDQKIINYPNKRQYIQSSRLPVLSLFFEKGISSTTQNYNYTFASISTKYSNNIDNLGNLFIGFSIGKFFEKNDIAFTDYKHFNGNQTFIGSSPIYNKSFNLLPYYEYSTNESYVEFHAEHDFRGFLINKIPLLNKTRYSFIIGFHSLSIPEKNTHREYSIGLNNFGFGKFRPFRIDFFSTLSGDSPRKNGVILGIKVLDLIQK